MFYGDEIKQLDKRVTDLEKECGDIPRQVQRLASKLDRLLDLLGIKLVNELGFTAVNYRKSEDMVTADRQRFMRRQLNALMDYLGVEEETIEAQPEKTIIRAKAPKTKVSEEAQ
jgi:hypothetical protein